MTILVDAAKEPGEHRLPPTVPPTGRTSRTSQTSRMSRASQNGQIRQLRRTDLIAQADQGGRNGKKSSNRQIVYNTQNGVKGRDGSSGRSSSNGRKTNPRPAVRADDFSTRFVTVHGYRRAYVRAGRGPAILLIHGIGDNGATWQEIVPRLATEHTVVVPDLLGHGKSDKPRGDYSVAGYACGMRDLLTVLGIRRVTVVGHSLGGGVAMQFAYQFPERCERLVLVSTGGVGPDLHALLRMCALPGTGLLLALAAKRPVRSAGWAVTRLLRALGTDAGRDADDLLRVMESLQAPTARHAFLRTLRAAVDGRGQAITMLDRCYLAAGMPSLIVWGAHDAVIPVEHARIAHEAMPGSRLEIFPEAGHFPHHTDPDRFQAVLEDFLATTRPASHSRREWQALLRSHGEQAHRSSRGSSR